MVLAIFILINVYRSNVKSKRSQVFWTRCCIWVLCSMYYSTSSATASRYSSL